MDVPASAEQIGEMELAETNVHLRRRCRSTAAGQEPKTFFAAIEAFAQG